MKCVKHLHKKITPKDNGNMFASDQSQLFQKIGQGGYGEIYKTNYTGKIVAVKVIPRKTAKEKAFTREVLALRKVQNNQQHVLTFVDSLVTQVDYRIITEFIEGVDLYRYVQQKTCLPEQECKTLFNQMARGLHHIHSMGILHRDIKLENCMLDRNSNIKWIDFGLSHVYSRPGEFLTVYCGSHSYCAPEIIQRKPYTNFHSDIWSIGVCLFAMLYGFFPYESAREEDWRFDKMLVYSRTHDNPSITYILDYYVHEEVSPTSTKIIDSMLRIRPMRRVTAQILVEDAWLKEDIFDAVDMQT